MTKKEIIQNIKTRISTIESYHPEEYALNKSILLELKDLLSTIEKDEPSLPSNVDKVAEKYGAENCNTWYTDIESVLVGRPRQRECNDSFDLQEAFKAGAEWEAEALIEWEKT